MEWKLHAFVVIQTGRCWQQNRFCNTSKLPLPQGKVGFRELCAGPLGVRIGPNLVILVHEEKAVAESGTLRKGYKQHAAGAEP